MAATGAFSLMPRNAPGSSGNSPGASPIVPLVPSAPIGKPGRGTDWRSYGTNAARGQARQVAQDAYQLNPYNFLAGFETNPGNLTLGPPAGSGNPMHALMPSIRTNLGSAFSTPGRGYELLPQNHQDVFSGIYSQLMPDARQQAVTGYQQGGLAGAYPALSSYDSLTPGAQEALLAKYQALPPDVQAQAAEAFSRGGLVAAMPHLTGAFDAGEIGLGGYAGPPPARAPELEVLTAPPVAPTTPGQIPNISPEGNARLMAQYNSLPLLGFSTTPGSAQNGVAPLMTFRESHLTPAGNDALNAQFASLPPEQQQRVMAVYNAVGLEAALPLMNWPGEPPVAGKRKPRREDERGGDGDGPGAGPGGPGTGSGGGVDGGGAP